MGDKLIHRIAQKVAVDYCRLSIVSNPDGLLLTDDVRYLLLQEEGITIASGSPIELRIHYELVLKQSEEGRFVYVVHNVHEILPDIRKNAFITNFTLADLFPMINAWSISHVLQYDVLSALYEFKVSRKLNAFDSEKLLGDLSDEVKKKKENTAVYFRKLFDDFHPDWANPANTISEISRIIVHASKEGLYSTIEDSINRINNDFQNWVDNSYFAALNSNPLLSAKSVNKILPHIAQNYGQEDKVALIVVDGLAYWQYVILEEYLRTYGIEPVNNTTLAWLPTITMLSRQAIFRGDIPLQNYHQSPDNEKKLWFDYWQKYGLSTFEIQYISDKDSVMIESGVKRLAYVTMEMDYKMHSSSDMRDLYSLTDNWSRRFIGQIQAIKSKGFTIFLTSDHGGTLAHGWRALSSVEKAFLYKDGSRGKRHLIFSNESDKSFIDKQIDGISLIGKDNWYSVRDNQCFDNDTQILITHGGSHYLELLVPLIKI